MFNEKRRGHWSDIIKSTLRSLYGSIFLIFIAIIGMKNGEGIGDIIFLTIILIIPIISSIWSYYKTTFYISGNNLIYEKSGISKTRIEIPFDKINTMDEEVTIVDRIFKSCSLKVDNGVKSVDKAGNEVKLQLTIEDARNLQRYVAENRRENLLTKDSGVENLEDLQGTKSSVFKKLEDNIMMVESPSIDEENIVYKKVISFKEMIVYGLTKKKLFGVIGFLITAGLFISEISENMDIDFFTSALNYAENATVKMTQTKLTILFFAVAIALGIFIVISMISVIYEAIRLYNFTVEVDNKKVHIRYGLFKVKNYNIALDKIHAINIKQTIMQQIFNIYYVEGTVVGYGDEEKEKAIIFPILNKSSLDEMIKVIMPNYIEPKKINKVNNKVILIEMIGINLTLAIVGIVMSLLIDIEIISTIDNFIIILATVIVIGVNAICFSMYKKASIVCNKDVVEVCNGKLSKCRSIVKQSSIQSIEMSQGFIKRKLNAVSIGVNIYATGFPIHNVANGVDKSAYNEIIENLNM